VELHTFKISHAVGAINKTVSIGFAWMEEGDTPESLLKRADTALYEAKHSGRNKVLPLPDKAYVAPPSRSILKPFASAGAVADKMAQKSILPTTEGQIVTRYAPQQEPQTKNPFGDDDSGVF
jgi:hypothetical protein